MYSPSSQPKTAVPAPITDRSMPPFPPDSAYTPKPVPQPMPQAIQPILALAPFAIMYQSRAPTIAATRPPTRPWIRFRVSDFGGRRGARERTGIGGGAGF